MYSLCVWWCISWLAEFSERCCGYSSLKIRFFSVVNFRTHFLIIKIRLTYSKSIFRWFNSSLNGGHCYCSYSRRLSWHSLQCCAHLTIVCRMLPLINWQSNWWLRERERERERVRIGWYRWWWAIFRSLLIVDWVRMGLTCDLKVMSVAFLVETVGSTVRQFDSVGQVEESKMGWPHRKRMRMTVCHQITSCQCSSAVWSRARRKVSYDEKWSD